MSMKSARSHALRKMTACRHTTSCSIPLSNCWSIACGPCEVTSNWPMRMRRLPRKSAVGLMEFHWQSNSQPAGSHIWPQQDRKLARRAAKPVMGGRRTAPPRHQTLNATLEWSYDLLDEAEKRVLSRLSVFAGGFTFEAVVAVVADEMIDEANVSDCVWELRSKSMIAARGQEGRLRLLDTTLAFASRRLAESDEENHCRRRHSSFRIVPASR